MPPFIVSIPVPSADTWPRIVVPPNAMKPPNSVPAGPFNSKVPRPALVSTRGFAPLRKPFWMVTVPLSTVSALLPPVMPTNPLTRSLPPLPEDQFCAGEITRLALIVVVPLVFAVSLIPPLPMVSVLVPPRVHPPVVD